jgi:COP9 signalosome complex subunit 4
MFLDQIIRQTELVTFASSLKTHQLARLPTSIAISLPEGEEEEGKKGPETVLDRAVMEHNVLAASKVYNNITFKGLGLLLGLRPSAAEAMARIMIQQGRLKASIDQVDSIIKFDVEGHDGDGVVSNVALAAAGGAGGDEEEEDESATAPATKRWDEGIRATLQLVEGLAARCESLMAATAVTNGGGEMDVEVKKVAT